MKLAGDKCVTGKTGWSYCYEAMTRLQAIIAEKDGRPKPFRVYRCEFCSNYHLTSHEDRREIAVNPFKFKPNNNKVIVTTKTKTVTTENEVLSLWELIGLANDFAVENEIDQQGAIFLFYALSEMSNEEDSDGDMFTYGDDTFLVVVEDQEASISYAKNE